MKTIRECLEEQAELNKALIEGMQHLTKKIEELEARQTPQVKQLIKEKKEPINKVLIRWIRW